MLSTLGEMAPETFEMQFALVVGFAFAWEILFLVLRAIALTFFAGASQDDKKKHDKEEKDDVDEVRQKIVHVVHCVTNMIHTSIVGPTATWILFKAPAIRTITYAILNMDTSVLSSPTALHAFDADILPWLCPLSAGFFVFDLANIALWDKKDPLMVAHHVISIIVWPTGVATKVACPFILIFMSSELSSPLMQVRAIARALYGSGTASDVASLLFALAFFAVRSWTPPFCLYAFVAMKPWAYPIPLWQRIMTTTTVPLPALLNSVWTYSIASIMVGKLLQMSRSKKE